MAGVSQGWAARLAPPRDAGEVRLPQEGGAAATGAGGADDGGVPEALEVAPALRLRRGGRGLPGPRLKQNTKASQSTL